MKKLIIFTLCILSTISAMCQLYNDHDKSKLRAFLSQPSAVPSKTNGEQLGLTRADMSTWEVSESWVSKLSSTYWTSSPRRLRSFNWNYKSLSGVLDLSGCTSLSSLYNWGDQLTSANMSGCTSLTTLSFRDNQLTSLDASGCTSLTTLECHDNRLTSLDVSGCTSLTTLSCELNPLPSLDVSGCPSLETLSCGSMAGGPGISGGRLTVLDVSNCPSLRSLECSTNRLTSLDLSHNLSLTDLRCNSNQLTSLDLSHNVLLTKLECSSNPLMRLDVSHNALLQSLTCHANFLTTLDVSHNANLTDLHCLNNQLTSLDVSHNALLTELQCGSNPLTTLDVSSNSLLTTLECGHNDQLISVDVSGCLELESFDARYTSLPALDLRNNLWLKDVMSAGCPLTDIYVGWESPILGIAAATTYLSWFHGTTAVLQYLLAPLKPTVRPRVGVTS